MIKQKEIVWIDWVKFICMIFVYWDHIILYGNGNAPFIIPFRSFFVNAFFFISGYLIFMKELSPYRINVDRLDFLRKAFSKKGMVMNIVFRIAIPTILFSIPLFFPVSILRGEEITINLFIFDRLIKGSYWFTCALTVSETIIFLLLITRIRNIFFYLIGTLFLAIVGVYLQNINFLILGNEFAPWFYKSGLIATLFLAFGGLYYKYEEKFDNFSIIYISLFIIFSNNFNQDRIPMSTWAGINLVGFIISLISILAIINLCKSLSPRKITKYISRHTIGFYFLSVASPFLCIRLCNMLLPENALSFTLKFLLSLMVSWIIVFLLNKYLPFIFDLRVLFRSQKL